MFCFNIIEHTVKTQHTRDRPAGAERGRDNDLRLHVKQYIPKTNTNPNPGDVTIVGAHANGFPKELYEPFWVDFVQCLAARGRQVRGIWIADIASQGQSGVINESLLGPDASWWDHGRDLLFLINQFQDEMPQPLIGLGHSVGASQLTHLSLLHPRLLHSLVLVDATAQLDILSNKQIAQLSSIRRDTWPSRAEAARSFASNEYYQKWDPRVLEKWIQYGLRDLPTEQYPDNIPDDRESSVPVTLTTTVAQEVYFYVRAIYPEDRLLQNDDNLTQDIHPADLADFPLSRPESQQIFRRLPEVRPSVLYICGKQSAVSTLARRRSKMEATGTGVGGNGGVAKGRVSETVLDTGHLVAFEKPGDCAEASAAFIAGELSRWNAEERERDRRWHGLSRQQRVQINDKWRHHLQLPLKQERPRTGKSDTKL